VLGFQNLEEMIRALQEQVSSLKHHNDVLSQLLELHKDLAAHFPERSRPNCTSLAAKKTHVAANRHVEDTYELKVIQEKIRQLSSLVGSQGEQFVPLMPETDNTTAECVRSLQTWW